MSEDQQRAAEQGIRSFARDTALSRLDETEIKSRLMEAFDAFIDKGYECHLIGVMERGSVLYHMSLNPDGADDMPAREIMAVADLHRLELVIDKHMGLVLYPRW